MTRLVYGVSIELTPFSIFNSTSSILGKEKNAFLPAQERKIWD